MARCSKCDSFSRRHRVPFAPPLEEDEVNEETGLCWACDAEKGIAKAALGGGHTCLLEENYEV
jgi:hypothetical protein